jgi:hypothetical protein
VDFRGKTDDDVVTAQHCDELVQIREMRNGGRETERWYYRGHEASSVFRESPVSMM